MTTKPRQTKTSAAKTAKSAKAAPGKLDLGKLPEWDLSDLYKSPQAPEVKRDLDAASAEARRMKSAYQGRLAEFANDGGQLIVPVKDYEKLSDLMGKLGSYAGLYYAQNQADQDRAKF